ncbi:hypothetical protein [Acinetobacter gyllenbergii]|uniref:hypothetical protein n=1 Tax=Acinetobacter gyllenbergii TaxID=134534 RepID=UPI0008069E43|nr:hypothetical protein [Acinetobacter gyllenbergii]OBY72356.1 hypothetical protein NG55_20395 [Acinetobacter gyllenbergii]
MKGLITGVLLAVTSTYALAEIKIPKTPKGQENKYYVKYDTKNKKIVQVGTYESSLEAHKKCTDALFKGKDAKKLEEMAKGKTGIVELIYYCRH